MSQRSRLSLRKALKYLLVAGLFIFLGWYAYGRWQEVQDTELALSIPHLVIGVLLLFAFYNALSYTWQRVLDMIRAKPQGTVSRDYHRALLLAFVTRYLPAGNVLTVGSRVELLKRLGGARSQGFESVYYEQLYLTVGAFLLGLATYLVAGADTLPAAWWSRLAWVLAGIALVGTVVIALGAEKALQIVVRLFKIDRLDHLGTRLQFGHKLELVFRFLVINAIQGGSAYFLLRSVYPALPADFTTVLIVVAAYPLSRFVGQAAAVVPGGLGIREGAFTFLLGPFLPVKPVLISAGLFRLVSVLMELFLLGTLLALDRVRSPR